MWLLKALKLQKKVISSAKQSLAATKEPINKYSGESKFDVFNAQLINGRVNHSQGYQEHKETPLLSIHINMCVSVKGAYVV